MYYDQVSGSRSDRTVSSDLWADVMQLSFLHYLKNSMLPIQSVSYITTSRRTRVLLLQHRRQRVYIIIHSISSNRLCSNKHNSKVNSNTPVTKDRRPAPLARAGVTTLIIKITTQTIIPQAGRLAIPLQGVVVIFPLALHVVPALALAHRLSNCNSPMVLRSRQAHPTLFLRRLPPS